MNKIGWCDLTWNPVWGCRNHCEYCYARGIAKRFYNVLADKEYKYMYYRKEICTGEFANRLRHFVPTFINSQFDKELPKKPQRIFVGSMSEIAHWEAKWMNKVIFKIFEYPQHTFQFLTKFPGVYSKWEFPDNCWLGVTVTKNERIYSIGKHKSKIRFLSVEPLLEEIDIGTIDDFEPDWIIVGAESGDRKGKVIPKKEWLNIIIDFCNRTGVPLYLKDSLKNIYPKEIKEFPEVVK